MKERKKYIIEEITPRDVWQYNRNEIYAKDLEMKVHAVLTGIGAITLVLTLQNAIDDPSFLNLILPILGGSGFILGITGMINTIRKIINLENNPLTAEEIVEQLNNAKGTIYFETEEERIRGF